MVIKCELCARWKNTVCFLGVAAGSVCREEYICSVVVGHHDRDQRNDVLRINKLTAVCNISFYIVNSSLCHKNPWRVNPIAQIVCFLCSIVFFFFLIVHIRHFLAICHHFWGCRQNFKRLCLFNVFLMGYCHVMLIQNWSCTKKRFIAHISPFSLGKGIWQ